MIRKFISLFEPPVFDDPDKTRIASHIFLLGKIGAILSLVESISTIVMFGFSGQFFITLFGFIIINVLPMFLVKKGFVRLAGTIYTGILWLGINYGAITLGGIRAEIFSANLVILVGVAILVDLRATFLMIGATSVFGFWLVTLEVNGGLPPIDEDFSIYAAWISQSTFLVLNGGLLYIAITRIQSSLKSAQIAEKKLSVSHQDLEVAYETTLDGWAQALELRDKETEGHSRRVTQLAMTLGERLGLSANDIKHIYYGALLHDIGKMGIPDEILNKPGLLTHEERAIVQEHPGNAYRLLKDIAYLQPAISIPFSHHERWDGAGYPQGLAGEDIPLFARIFMVVDVWDALTSDRPYRDAWSREKTIEYIQENRGKMFDPRIAEEFLGMIDG